MYQSDDMKYVILAAGKGTRMGHKTDACPKPMLKINDEPFLHYVLKNIKAADPNCEDKDVCIVVNYQKHVIEEWTRKYHPNITLVEQNNPKGTGDAVLTARAFTGADEFIMINGDDLYDPRDIANLLASEKGMCYGIGYLGQDVTKYAAMITDDDEFLTEIKEKPTEEQIREIVNPFANANLWKFTPEVFNALQYMVDNEKVSPRGEYEITDAAQILAKKRLVKIIPAVGYWEKLGCPKDIELMEAFLKELGR